MDYSGFDFELREVDKEILEQTIVAANTDDMIDGVIIYFPVFNTRQVRHNTLQYKHQWFSYD